jgi:hypothetical protein
MQPAAPLLRLLFRDDRPPTSPTGGKTMRTRPILSVLTVLFLLAAAPAAFAGDHVRDFTFDANHLVVANLVGAIDVVPATGDAFRVTVHVRGEDAAEGLVQVVVDEGSRTRLAIEFPVEEHDDYVYPELGRNSKTTIHIGDEDDGSWIKKMLPGIYGKKVTVKGRGNGLEIWADVTVEVPRGRELEVLHGVGRISAGDLAADLVLDSHAGPIEVAAVEGDVLCDTGSGSVKAHGVRGDLTADTGSGSVHVSDCEGPEILVDTGSGSVRVETVDCGELVVDTGSGSVTARGIQADSANIDTGSGSVELHLDRLGPGRFVVDTGSGGIDLVLPPGASARVVAATGSGRIRNEVEGADVRHQERDELDMTVGAGDARVSLDAGSGSVTISGG